jgi:heme-degrading monooxygenase HmoA
MRGFNGPTLPDGAFLMLESRSMYIAMNHFRVRPDRAADFETAWRTRESYLSEVPGFREFHLLRGPLEEDARLYASHSVWQDEAAFRAWTESESFRKAHAQGKVGDLLLGPPRFVGWQAILGSGLES